MIAFYKKIFPFFILIIACASKEELTIVDSSNPQIQYSGRIDTSKINGMELYWSGTSIKFHFEGKSISALIEDEKGDNYYNVIIDDNDPFIFRPDTLKHYHQLASDLSGGKHSIEIFKRTEWDRGKTTFYGFQLNGKGKALPRDAPQKRKIEFYGNSITAGYAVEDTSGKDSPDSTYTNNYLSYAAITARHFDAEYQCICRSGIGITVSWIPLIMPEMYDRLIPSDSNSKWNFLKYSPDIVVVNLFQNDSWLVNMPDNDQFKARFGTEAPGDEDLINAYQEFISVLRQHYPDANIICSLGCMDAVKDDSKWIGYIQEAVANLNDKAIYTYFMPYIEAQAHPSVQDQAEMARGLIEFIEENIPW